MNDDYSDAFKSIIPTAPSADGWADGARRKRRNRRAAIAGVAGAAVLALVFPIALSMGGEASLIASPQESASVPPVPDPAQDAPGAAACWEAPGQSRGPTDEGATKGAVRAWLCGDAGDLQGFPGAVGPLEPLVEGVDEFVELLQRWESFEYEYEYECTAGGGTKYRIVLDYADGSRRVVAGTLDDCDTISDGEQSLPGAQELYDRAVELWSQQRESMGPPVSPDPARQCLPPSRSAVWNLPPANRPMLPLTPAEAVTGFTCVESPDSTTSERWSSDLDPATVALIANSLESDSEEGLGAGQLSTWVTITGAWGEALTLQRMEGNAFQWFDSEGAPMLWTPSMEILEQLDADMERPSESTLPPSDVTMPPAIFVPDGCSRVAAGAGVSRELPEDELPPDPAKIWFCAVGLQGEVGPVEPLESPELISRAVAAYNSSPGKEYDSACVDPSGPEYAVVHEYAGGKKYSVGVQIASCDVIAAGLLVKDGAQAYADTLLDLWQEQRITNPVVQERPGPFCPGLGSVFAIDARQTEFSSGHACVGWKFSGGGYVGPTDEVDLSAAVVDELSTQLAMATNDLPDDMPSGGGLVFLTRDGDPFTLFNSSNGTLTWFTEEGEQWFFTPTGALADALEEIFAT